MHALVFFIYGEDMGNYSKNNERLTGAELFFSAIVRSAIRHKDTKFIKCGIDIVGDILGIPDKLIKLVKKKLPKPLTKL